LDPALALQAVRASEAAAVAAWSHVGRGDEKAADQAAVEAMRSALNDLEIDGVIVIGEGERDEAPLLFVGERVGKGNGPHIDIALDSLEGTSLAAKNMANALVVMALAPTGTLLNVPDVYMDKIACGPGYPEYLLDLDRSAAENAQILAVAKGVKVKDLAVCVLDRPRNADIIASLRESGVRVCLITDGDIAGVMNTADSDTGIDMYVGRGGARAGVLSCAALKCAGGQFQGRLIFRNSQERTQAKVHGIGELDKKYDLRELIRGDVIFVATGVTNGALLDGVKINGATVSTHTLVMNSQSRTVEEIRMKRPLR
jgi:fructose-1,6-bisphosphatase II / sedoheptulose-1,7-bisphosphatase